MNYKESSEILEKIKSSESILINCHHLPDADSVGGALALSRVLNNNFQKNTKIICPSPIPKNLRFLGTDEIEQIDFSKFDYSGFDLFILLDTASWSRAAGSREVEEWKIPMIVIDHHDSGGAFGELNLVDKDSAANCQVLYKIFQDWSVPLGKRETSEPLLTGIIGDTGAFRFPEADIETISIAHELMKTADKQEIIFNLFQSFEQSHVAVWKEMMENMQVDAEYGFVYSFVDSKVFVENGRPFGAKSEIADMLFQAINGTDFGLVGVMDEDYMSVSFRSRTGYDVSALAEVFGGGGHIWASAARIEGHGFAEAREITLRKVREHVEKTKEGNR